MCERYFVEFPPHEPLTPEHILEESLALVHPKDIQLHRTVFFVPFEVWREVPEKKRLWSRNQRRTSDYAAANILRHNIRFMIQKTKNFGLLLSQLTWVGLLNFAEKRRVLQHCDDNLRTAALYIIMLKKEANGMTQFINCLHMTGNHEIANMIEAKLELLVEKFGYCEHHDHGQCTSGFETSLEDGNAHYLPPKKRKTSADSGFDDSDEDDELESSLASGAATRRYKCNIRPLDAVDVIAIINGKEDSLCKVEICKCGHYHQFPKWKDVNSAKENLCNASSSASASFTESGIIKYFSKKGNALGKQGTLCHPRKGILSPATQQIEMGLEDLSEDLEFTQPRRSCPKLRLRFSSVNEYAEHPDNVEETVNENTSSSLKSRLPRFLRRLF